MHARANLSSMGVIIATSWTPVSVIASEIPTQMLQKVWIRSWSMEVGDVVVVCKEDRAAFNALMEIAVSASGII